MQVPAHVPWADGFHVCATHGAASSRLTSGPRVWSAHQDLIPTCTAFVANSAGSLPELCPLCNFLRLSCSVGLPILGPPFRIVGVCPVLPHTSTLEPTFRSKRQESRKKQQQQRGRPYPLGVTAPSIREQDSFLRAWLLPACDRPSPLQPWVCHERAEEKKSRTEQGASVCSGQHELLPTPGGSLGRLLQGLCPRSHFRFPADKGHPPEPWGPAPASSQPARPAAPAGTPGSLWHQAAP